MEIGRKVLYEQLAARILTAAERASRPQQDIL